MNLELRIVKKELLEDKLVFDNAMYMISNNLEIDRSYGVIERLRKKYPGGLLCEYYKHYGGEKHGIQP